MFLSAEQLLKVGRKDAAIVALRDGQPLLWGEFAPAVAKLAATLAPGQRYALVAEDAWLFAIGLFAIWQAGGAVMVPNNALPETLQTLAGEFDGVLDNGQIGLRLASDVVPQIPVVLDGEACQLTLFTSGSSGEPKSIRKCLRQLSAEVTVLEQCWGAEAGTVPVLATVPHHHIYGLLFRLLWPLSAGRSFEVMPRFLPENLLHAAGQLGEVLLVASPAQLSRLPQLIELSALLPHLRLCFSSGGPLSAQTAAAFVEAGDQPPLEVFGSTETGGVAWRRQKDGDLAWQPLPGVRCEIAADGALCVSSPFLPDDAPWQASDTAGALPDGRFILQGRRDRVVKLEEKRLSLGEQEQRLAAHLWVDGAFLLVLPARRQTLCVVLKLSAAGETALQAEGKLALQQALRHYLAAWYEPVLLPRRWRIVDVLPQTERGKADWPAMQALFEKSDHE